MEQQKTDLCEATLQLARKAGYQNAGVAKFLMDIKGEAALTEHPGSLVAAADLDVLREEATKVAGRSISDEEFNS